MDTKHDFEQDIRAAIETLEKGGTILYPTDTVWGVGCDATNEAAVDKIFRLKKRPDNKALIVLVADEREVLKHVAGVDLGVFDYIDRQTRPVTVIYSGAIGLADNLIGSDGSIGIRICKEEFCRALLKRFRKPIVSTSANISGEPAPATFASIDPAIRNGVNYVVRYRQDDDRIASPSTVIKWNDDATPTVLRP